MAKPLRVLIVEDSAADADVMVAELRRHGFDPAWTRVQTEDEYCRLLGSNVDLILADYSMPQFGARQALAILHERGLDVPLIVVSGAIGEEIAVAALREGAVDYLLKDRLTRLGQAVSQAVEQKALREERKRAEEASRESEARYRVLFEQSVDAIYITDRNGMVVDANQAAVDLLGYSRGEVIGADLREAYADPADHERFQREIEKSGAVQNYETRLRRKDGSERSCLTTATIRRSADGRILGYQGILRDVTELRLLEEQFRQAQKMEAVGQLAGGVAHDFNNLLTAIHGYSQLLYDELDQADPRRLDLEEVLKAAERAAGLTTQLLAFSRRQILQPKVVDLNSVLRGMIQMLRRLIGEHIELVTVLDDSLGTIKADPGQMAQVVMNLAVNARDAMPQGGTLRIETANADPDSVSVGRPLAPGRFVLLTVSDTGIGMDAATKRRVFEPFFTTKGPGRGTGLGLATVYGIVKQSDGHIWIDSEPGCGATFRIYLHRIDEPVEDSEAPCSDADGLRGTETLLLVEDEEAVRLLARAVLERNGYRVLDCGDPEEAVAVSRAQPDAIHLLVTDVVMPKLNGRELVRRLAKERPLLRVLYISGYAGDAIVEDGVLAPDVEFLQKPFTANALLRKVRRILDAGEAMPST